MCSGVCFLRVLFLRQLLGPSARIVLCRVDGKDAFRQVLLDPVGAPVFGFVMGEYGVVDLRLQFGWRNSPRFWGLMASALEHSYTHPTFEDAAVSPQGAAAVEHVGLAAQRGGSVTSLPRIFEPFPVAAATPGVVFPCILVQVQWWPDGRRCMRAVQSLASDHFRVLGVRGASDPPLLSASKITNWNTRLDVLGWWVDTAAFTVTAPPHNRLKLRLLLVEWPPTAAPMRCRSWRVSSCTSLSPFVPGLFSCIVCWLWLGCRTSLPVITSLFKWPIRGGVMPLGPRSMRISSSGSGLLTNVLMRAAGCCRHRCILCWSARHNVRCSRTCPEPPSGDVVSKPVVTGAMISAQKQSRFAARVSPSAAWTTYLSTCLNVWAWLCRRLS